MTKLTLLVYKNNKSNKKISSKKKTMLIKDIKIVKVITTYITGED